MKVVFAIICLALAMIIGFAGIPIMIGMLMWHGLNLETLLYVMAFIMIIAILLYIAIRTFKGLFKDK